MITHALTQLTVSLAHGSGQGSRFTLLGVRGDRFIFTGVTRSTFAISFLTDTRGLALFGGAGLGCTRLRIARLIATEAVARTVATAG